MLDFKTYNQTHAAKPQQTEKNYYGHDIAAGSGIALALCAAGAVVGIAYAALQHTPWLKGVGDGLKGGSIVSTIVGSVLISQAFSEEENLRVPINRNQVVLGVATIVTPLAIVFGVPAIHDHWPLTSHATVPNRTTIDAHIGARRLERTAAQAGLTL